MDLRCDSNLGQWEWNPWQTQKQPQLVQLFRGFGCERNLNEYIGKTNSKTNWEWYQEFSSLKYPDTKTSFVIEARGNHGPKCQASPITSSWKGGTQSGLTFNVSWFLVASSSLDFVRFAKESSETTPSNRLEGSCNIFKFSRCPRNAGEIHSIC